MPAPSYKNGPEGADRDTLEELYHGDGKTLVEIGDEFGVSGVTIRNWMEHYGIERNQPGFDRGPPTLDDALDLILDRSPKPTTVRTLADEYGVTRETARKRLHEIEQSNPHIHQTRIGSNVDIWWYDGEGGDE